MKRSLFILSLLMATISLSAQSVLSFGLRGGLEFMVPKSELSAHSKAGYAGIVDIGYTYYWFSQVGDWGIHTGLSAGYGQNACQIGIQDIIYRQYHDGSTKQFTINGDLNVVLKRGYCEVPLMAAYHKNGIVARLGIKGQYAFGSRTTLKIKTNDYSSIYAEMDMPMNDNTYSGGSQKTDLEGGAPSFSLLAAMYIGYELRMRKTDRLGVGAYLDCTMWNIGNNSTEGSSAMWALFTRINPIQVGFSVYYALEFRSYRHASKSPSMWEEGTYDVH